MNNSPSAIANASSSKICTVDHSFGPGAINCRRGLDFTLLFEESIFGLLPAVIFILIAPIRLWQLSRAQKRVFDSNTGASKLTNIGFLAIIKLALVILWATRSPIKTKLSIAAAAASFAECIALAAVSHAEHAKSLRPSSLLALALVVSLAIDVVRLRTFYMMNFDNLITSLYSASFALKLSILMLEARTKRQFLKGADVDKPPEETSGLLSRSVFWWLNSLFLNGYRNILSLEDLFVLDETLSDATVQYNFDRMWKRNSQSQKRLKLLKTLFTSLRSFFLSPILPIAFSTAALFGQPLLINRMIRFITSDEPKDVGYLLIACYTIDYIAIAVFTAYGGNQIDRLTTTVRGTLVTAIYDQSLQLNLSEAGNGASITLMSADVEKIVLGLKLSYFLLSNTVFLILALYLLYAQVGIAFLAPVAVVLICGFLTSQTAGSMVKAQQGWMHFAQERVAFTSSVIASMKGVKTMGLVRRIRHHIDDLRRQEIQKAQKLRKWIVFSVALSEFAADGSKWLTFLVFGLITIAKGTHSNISVSRLFTALAILSIAVDKMRELVQLVPTITSAYGCMQRIENFLLAETKTDSRQLRRISSGSNHTPDSSSRPQSPGKGERTLQITEMSASWTKDNLVLQDINLEIRQGTLTTIVGPVGSGKSSLLLSILGETYIKKGFVNVSASLNSMSFCAQTPWLVNRTVRENIIGISHYDASWYQQVIASCALMEDLKLYPKGDQTLVGTKGITLSGGQKQRIALARTIYSKKPVVLLDDVFSGLDVITEEWIFQQLLGRGGLLRNGDYTVVLATHSQRPIAVSDRIVTLDTEGRATILSQKSIEFDLFKADSTTPQSTPQKTLLDEAIKVEEELQKQELDMKRQTGDFTVYKYFIKSMGIRNFIEFILLIAVAVIFILSQNVLLQQWSQRTTANNTGVFLGIYSGIVVCSIFFIFLCLLHFMLIPIPRASQRLHYKQLDTMMRGLMSFFSKTDVGITTNRFSQDMMLVDNELPISMINCFANGLVTVGTTIIIVVTTPWVGLAIPFLIGIFWFLQRFYLNTSRQVRLLDLEAKSPLYTHFLETLNGLSTIRAFGWEEDFRNESIEYLNKSQKPLYLLATIQRWLELVLGLIVSGLGTLVVVLAVQLRTSVNPSLLGLALVSITQVGEMLKMVILFWTLLETSIGAVSRIRSFVRETPTEDIIISGEPFTNLIPNGKLQIDNLSASHQLDSEIVLKNVSLSIAPGEKVGICGRSGSGKTSLTSTLFRLLEIRGGAIKIDNVDITSMDVNDLRASINVLSQDPFFLKGSVRQNLSFAEPSLDVVNIFDDEQLHTVLDKVGVLEKILSHGGLDAELDPEGSLSHGERQLFCLARAMLKKSKLLILDEFTSSVDLATDAAMQRVMRDSFPNVTTIAVVHRLDTIIDFNRVVVMDSGIVVEVGNPQQLLNDRNSLFRNLYNVYKQESTGAQ